MKETQKDEVEGEVKDVRVEVEKEEINYEKDTEG